MNDFKEIKRKIKFGSYWLLKQLGIGGSSELLLAIKEGEEGFVVLKRLLPIHLENKIMIERFNREIEIMKKIKHRSICNCLNYGVIENRPYIVLEYLKGGTLSEFIRECKKKKNKIPLSFIALIGLDVSSAILETRKVLKKGVILHLDISPQNIFITMNGYVKLLDFGSSIFVSENQKSVIGTIGKARYMSPEQIKGMPLDERTDIYSLGITLYEAISGESVIKGENISEITENVIKGNLHLKKIPKGGDRIGNILKNAFCYNPDMRYSNFLHFSKELKRSLEGKKIREIRKKFKSFINLILKELVESKLKKYILEIPESAEMKGEETSDVIGRDEITLITEPKNSEM